MWGNIYRFFISILNNKNYEYWKYRFYHYDKYFKLDVDAEAIIYLQLPNSAVH